MFDEQPDGGLHGECALEIKRLNDLLAAVTAQGEPVAWMWHEPASEWNGYEGRMHVSLAKPKPTAAPGECVPPYAASANHEKAE